MNIDHKAPLKLPRFRLPTLMIATALYCAVVGFLVWRSESRTNDKARREKRRAAFESLAAFHVGKASWASAGCTKTHCTFSNSDGEVLTEEFKQYHSGLAAKYRGAARYPWLPVAPDPPLPK